MAQLWGGRFTKETDQLVYNFNASITFDRKLYRQDIRGSLAHVKMLAKHSPGSAIEVLLFAIARQMVVEHTSPVENLISIVAILLIFVIRKYLFVPAFGAHMPGADTFSESGLSSDMKEKLAELHLQQAHMKEELQKMNQQCMMVPRTEKEQAGSQE